MHGYAVNFQLKNDRYKMHAQMHMKMCMEREGLYGTFFKSWK